MNETGLGFLVIIYKVLLHEEPCLSARQRCKTDASFVNIISPLERIHN